MRNTRNQKGFTLIELMIVVVIIGILAALAIPRFTQTARSARAAEADPLLKQVCTMQSVYFERFGSYATDAAALQQVGWEAPTTPKYYNPAPTWTGADWTALTVTLTTADAAQAPTKSIVCSTGLIAP